MGFSVAWQRQRDTCTMLFSWENMQGWPPLLGSSCSNCRILAEFLLVSGRKVRPRSNHRTIKSRFDVLSMSAVFCIQRLKWQVRNCWRCNGGYSARRSGKAQMTAARKILQRLVTWHVTPSWLHICKAWEYPGSRCEIHQDSQIMSGLSKLSSTALLSAEPTAAENPQSRTPEEWEKRKLWHTDATKYNQLNQMYANASCHNLGERVLSKCYPERVTWLLHSIESVPYRFWVRRCEGMRHDPESLEGVWIQWPKSENEDRKPKTNTGPRGH